MSLNTSLKFQAPRLSLLIETSYHLSSHPYIRQFAVKGAECKVNLINGACYSSHDLFKVNGSYNGLWLRNLNPISTFNLQISSWFLWLRLWFQHFIFLTYNILFDFIFYHRGLLQFLYTIIRSRIRVMPTEADREYIFPC